MYKLRILLLVSLALSLPAIACNAPAVAPVQKPVEPWIMNIGACLGLSGDIAGYGKAQRAGIEVAVKEVASSNYLGAAGKMQIVIEDSGASPEGAEAAMRKLISVPGISGLIGPTLSSQAFAADPLVQKSAIPLIAISNTVPGITEMGNFIFRCSMPESSVIAGTIKSASVQGVRRVVILWGKDDDYTIAGYKAFKDACDKNRVTILAEQPFIRGDTDFKVSLERATAQNPDAICVSALIKEAIAIVIQARNLGYSGPIIGGNGFNSTELIRQAGEAAEGVMVGTAWNYTSTNIRNLEFITLYEKAVGGKPDQFAAQAYTAIWLFADAVKSAGASRPEAVRNSLAKMTNLNTPLGIFSFTQDREPVHPTAVQVVRNGKFTILSR